MFIFFSKFLPPFVYPLGLACLLIAAGIFFAKRPRLQRVLLLLALALLFLGSNRWVAFGLMRSLEWQYLPPAELPRADVIVVLGGGTQSAQYPRPMVDLNSAGDRIVYAAWLYQQGAAEHLLLSSGSIEWLSTDNAPAEDMASLLELMGVPRQALWLETTSRNTYENAANSRAILEPKGIQRIILVTSAAHMPRSAALFEHQGFEVIPAPTDYRVTQAMWDQLHTGDLGFQLVALLPGAGNLNMTSQALKEYLGIFVYHLRGWL